MPLVPRKTPAVLLLLLLLQERYGLWRGVACKTDIAQAIYI